MSEGMKLRQQHIRQPVFFLRAMEIRHSQE
jgi:hypothetical protein